MPSDIRTSTVQVTSGDLHIDAYLAEPADAGSYPAVVVLQEIFGVNAHIRDVADRVAREGYLAIAPALYQRLEPGFEVGYAEADLQRGREYKDRTTAEELLGDIQGAIDYLKQTKSASRFGCMGFCFGGHVAYLAATLPDIQATASFYGAGIVSMTPGGGEPTITRTPEISGTVYVFLGTVDPLIPNEEGDRVEEALKQHNIDHRVFRYEGCDHGFFCDQRGSYNAEAAADAWEKVKELFAQKLR